MFQPTTGAMKVYTTSNGLLGDQFNYHSSLETEDGTVIWEVSTALSAIQRPFQKIGRSHLL